MDQVTHFGPWPGRPKGWARPTQPNYYSGLGWHDPKENVVLGLRRWLVPSRWPILIIKKIQIFFFTIFKKKKLTYLLILQLQTQKI